MAATARRVLLCLALAMLFISPFCMLTANSWEGDLGLMSYCGSWNMTANGCLHWVRFYIRKMLERRGVLRSEAIRWTHSAEDPIQTC